MTLKQTVSKILNKEVTDEQAKEFAMNQYGVLATYIKNQSRLCNPDLIPLFDDEQVEGYRIM